MNLVNCAEKCHYQEDGLCQLPVGACASSVPTKSCCYFVPLKQAESNTHQDDKNKQKFT